MLAEKGETAPLGLWGAASFLLEKLTKPLDFFFKPFNLFLYHRFHVPASGSQFMILAEIEEEVFFHFFYLGL